MEQLNKTPTEGKFGDVAKALDVNFGLIAMKLAELEEKSEGKNCGFYSSAAALNAAYPNPDKGMMAYVGSGTTYKVYRCTTAGTWTATDETYEIEITIDLDNFATKDELSALSADVEEILRGAVYGGMATTTSTPGTWKKKVFFVASEPGTYTNFGGVAVDECDAALLYNDGSGWKKHTLSIGAAVKTVKDAVKTISTRIATLNTDLSAAEEKSAQALDKATAAQKAADANKKEIARVDGNTVELRADTEVLQTTVKNLAIPKMVSMTETEYEALTTKDADTYYMITEG